MIRSLKVTWSYVVKVHKELKVTNGDSTVVDKCQLADKCPNTSRTPKFVQNVKKYINENHRESIKAIAKELKASMYSTERIVQEDLRSKLYVMRRGQFTSSKIKDKRLIRSNLLLSKLKDQMPGIIRFYL